MNTKREWAVSNFSKVFNPEQTEALADLFGNPRCYKREEVVEKLGSFFTAEQVDLFAKIFNDPFEYARQLRDEIRNERTIEHNNYSQKAADAQAQT